MVLTNVVLLAASPNAVEKKRDPVHFKRLFDGQANDRRHPVTHASNCNERLHVVFLGSGGELRQKFFSSIDR